MSLRRNCGGTDTTIETQVDALTFLTYGKGRRHGFEAARARFEGRIGIKVVILAGGAGTRLSEETSLRPKPMVEIGGMPMLWHIMKLYSHHGVNDFIIYCGYKGYTI